MAIIGFTFRKMLIESKEGVKGKLNVNNNVSIKGVSKMPITLGKETQDTLKFDFQFTAIYEPKAGKIELLGNVVYLTDEEKTKEIEEKWKKEKKIDRELMALLLNNILTRCNIQAILLAKEMNLPPTVPMPRVNIKAAEKEQK